MEGSGRGGLPLTATANPAVYTLAWTACSPPDEPDAGVMARTGPRPNMPPTSTGNSDDDDLLSFLRRHPLARAAGNWQVIGPGAGIPPLAEGLYMIGDGNGCHGAAGLVVLKAAPEMP